MKNKLLKNNNSAITLIALVITIIVLLILAGVTISTLTGENGLLNRAKIAKETSINSTTEENVTLDQYANTVDGYLTNARTEISTGIDYSKYLNKSVEIGKWTDGSTLYRTVLQGECGSGKDLIIADLSSYNIKEMTDEYGKMLTDGLNADISIPSFYNEYAYSSLYFRKDNKTLHLVIGPQYYQYTNNQYTIILEYTKN